MSPLLPGDELTDEPASTAEAVLLRRSGFESMVDATPTGLGRRPAALARAAAAADLRVVAATGAHREEHYGASHWLLDLDAAALADRFLAELVDGLAEADQPPPQPGSTTSARRSPSSNHSSIAQPRRTSEPPRLSGTWRPLAGNSSATT